MAAVACPLCNGQSFVHVNNLLVSLANFLQCPLNCPVCGFSATCSSVLSEHLVQHYHSALPPAPPPSSSLVDHHSCSDRNGEHPAGSDTKYYQCQQCNVFRAEDVSALKSHVESEHPDRRFLCTHCCKLFKAQASLTLHLKMAHQSGTIYHCQVCPKQVSSLHRKKVHEKRHLLAAAASSSASTSATSDALPESPPPPPQQQHNPSAWSAVAKTEEVKSFACHLCDKSFKKDQYLQQHIRTHEAKKWECHVCRKLFTTKEYLRKHTRLHTGRSLNKQEIN